MLVASQLRIDVARIFLKLRYCFQAFRNYIFHYNYGIGHMQSL